MEVEITFQKCVTELISLMQSDSSLCSAILSALENLRLTELQFTEPIAIFTSSLASVSLDDLPLVVGFVFVFCIDGSLFLSSFGEVGHNGQLRFLLRACPVRAGGTSKNGGESGKVLEVIRHTCDPSKWGQSKNVMIINGDYGQ